MRRNWLMLLLILVVFFAGCSSASATPPAKIVSGVVSKVVAVLFRWLWSFTSSKSTAITGRSMMKFEGGYTVETVFDGSKLGIEPYSVEVSPSGDLLVLDSANSNIYKISTPLSRYSRPKLVAGSSEGYSGHVDGKPREARMNHPKGHTIDERGNIYVADTTNMAIRKISDAGVVTIAGGTLSRGGGHVDGPSEDAKFSNDFDVVYVGSTCSLLVVDRGNQAIREIQLNDDECSQKYDGDLNLGIAVLAAAGFFGYMLALLQRRLIAMFSSQHEHRESLKGFPPAPYQKPPTSVRRPLIPTEHEPEKEEGLFDSLGKLFINASTSVVELFGGLFSGFRRQPVHTVQQQYYQQSSRHANAWPMQESFVIPNEDAPPPLDTRDPTPRKTYQSMTKDMEKSRQYKQNQSFYGGWNGDFRQQQQFQQHMHQQQQQLYQHLQQQQQQQQQKQVQQHHQRHQSSSPQTYFEQNCETNEIVFGAVQEHDGRHEAVVIKALDYADPTSSNHNIRSRYNYMGDSYGY